MMKVLWICNIVLPELCDVFGFRKTSVGGWITGLWEELQKEDLDLAVAVPILNRERMQDGEYQGYKYYSFLLLQTATRDEEQENSFESMIKDFEPDVIHIWGTEYLHTYSVLKVCQKLKLLDKTIVNIQGLVSIYCKHYTYGLPLSIVESEQIKEELASFYNRGNLEEDSICMARYVLGRTCWDKACVSLINPNVCYQHCGEILRKSFYNEKKKWHVENCEKHSIFISQASYPIKGLHLVLENIGNLVKQYEDLNVYVAGCDITKTDTVYAKYILLLIDQYKLTEKIHFLGMLTEKEMYERFLKTHVFLSASTIENSPNSVCEAMMVGTPVVASGVGGLFSIIENGKSGFLYPLDEPYMMEYYISSIFESEEVAMDISKAAISFAQKYNEAAAIVETVKALYQRICEEG